MPNVGLEIEEVEAYQFADVPFTIHAYFKDLSTAQIRTGETSNLKVLLAFEGNASSEFRCKEHHPNLLEVVSNTGIKEDGRATIVLKIKDVSMNHENKRFVVYLEGYRPHGNNNIIAAITNPITTIKHKLVLTEAYSAPYIWYKDEGAKDKSIKVVVKLIDAEQNVVTDRNIPLTVNLIYTSGQIVTPSTVLTIFHDRESKQLYVGNTGTETIRFRVNEVSRNHRKQLFHLSVAPTDTTLADISPATSIAFEVKSKRSSDARREQAAKADGEESGDEFIPITGTVPRAPSTAAAAAVAAATNPSTVAVTPSNNGSSRKTPSAAAAAAASANNANAMQSSQALNASAADMLSMSGLMEERMAAAAVLAAHSGGASLSSRLGFPATLIPPPINTFVRGK